MSPTEKKIAFKVEFSRILELLADQIVFIYRVDGMDVAGRT